MKKFDVQELLEVRESLKTQELKEHIDKILHMLEEGETFEVVDDGKVIAHVVPVSEPKQFGEQDVKASLIDTDRLAAKISAYSPEKVDAVEIVREGRRELPASESKQAVEQSDAAAWAKLKQIASELDPYWPKNMDAVDIVRDVRRDL